MTESLGKDAMVTDAGKCMGDCIELVIIKAGNVSPDAATFCTASMLTFSGTQHLRERTM